MESENFKKNLPPLPQENQKSKNISFSNNDDCRVAVRIRPDDRNVWKVDYLPGVGGSLKLSNEYSDHIKRRPEYFEFDAAFVGSDNIILYKTIAEDAVTSFMNGRNSLIFAYGQTGTGKTYSMMGQDTNPGIIPQAIAQIFNFIKEQSGDAEYLLRISYLEIYNETLKDLFNPNQKDLRIHEDMKRGVFVTPLKEEIVSDPYQVFELLNEGEMNRHMNSTNSNFESSRSHTLLQLLLESSKPGRDVTISRLHLIDLAGSEKAAFDIERQKEGSYINRSLLTLGTVISRLTTQEIDSDQHIPFRDSKLTRLLRPSLMGKSKICVIATLNPGLKNFDESLNTLKFASRVKKIIPRPELFQLLSEKALLQKYKLEVEELKQKLQDFNQTLVHQVPAKLAEDEKAKYEERLEDSRLASIRLKERIGHLTKLILTSKSVSEKQLLFPLFSENSQNRSAFLNTAFALSNSVNKVSSMPSLFSLNDSEVHNNDSSEDLLRRKLQALTTFIRSLKKTENKEKLMFMLDTFQLETFVDRRVAIPDLKLEAALKKIQDLKKEKNELEIVLLDNAHQTGAFKRKILELESLVGFNEKEMDEMSAIAKEQQELVEKNRKELEDVKLQFSEYRELVGKRRGNPPKLSSNALTILENVLEFENIANDEITNLVAFLKAFSC